MGDRKAMTVADVAAKGEWEGGVYVTAVEYGLAAEDIDDSTPEGARLRELWVQLQEAGKVTDALVVQIDAVLDPEDDADSDG